MYNILHSVQNGTTWKMAHPAQCMKPVMCPFQHIVQGFAECAIRFILQICKVFLYLASLYKYHSKMTLSDRSLWYIYNNRLCVLDSGAMFVYNHFLDGTFMKWKKNKSTHLVPQVCPFCFFSYYPIISMPQCLARVLGRWI